MCAASVTIGYMVERVPIYDWTPDKFDKFKQAIDLLAGLDKELGQPDCSDKDKLDYMKRVDIFLEAV